MAPPKADPAALAARSLRRLPGERVLLVDVPGGAAADTLCPEPDARFHWFSTDWPAHVEFGARGHRCHFGPWVGTGEAEGAEGAVGAWDAALVFLPKGRDRIRMSLAMVAGALPVGSPLWLVGAGRAGIESAADDLADFAELRSVEIGKHSRLFMATTRVRPEASLDDFLSTWTLPLPGRTLTVCSFPGVFSHGRLDEGTGLILSAVRELPGPRLDVGCGAGVIAAAYAHTTDAAGDTTLVDADALAVEAARRTLLANGLPGTVEPADVLPRDGTFRSIVSNPPFHRGVGTDHGMTERLVREAPARLVPGGTLTLVCNRFLPVPAQLDAAFGSHEVLAEDSRYKVLRATRVGARSGGRSGSGRRVREERETGRWR
jgi:16S rRNA (guanine1207-N2)-methyltransferase